MIPDTRRLDPLGRGAELLKSLLAYSRLLLQHDHALPENEIELASEFLSFQTSVVRR